MRVGKPGSWVYMRCGGKRTRSQIVIPREVVLSAGLDMLFPVIDFPDLSILMVADRIEVKCNKPFGTQLLLVG